ncbi:MAG TPA: AtpZ/AtpI family protein [Eudoraea sp.]|nr:AtpZ/AtpI family protein [Eudoraea sp.]
MNQQKPPRGKSPYNSYIQYSGIAIQMIVIIGLGSYGGVRLDEAYPNEYHAFTIICSLASVAMAIYVVIRQVSKASKN